MVDFITIPTASLAKAKYEQACHDYQENLKKEYQRGEEDFPRFIRFLASTIEARSKQMCCNVHIDFDTDNYKEHDSRCLYHWHGIPPINWDKEIERIFISAGYEVTARSYFNSTFREGSVYIGW